jgi:phenylacetate-CoA ligase
VRLRSILKHAAESVPYYRRFFSKHPIDPEKIGSPELSAALPILDKTTVQQNPKDFYSDRLEEMRFSMVHTSGTTGAGLVFPQTLEAEQEQWAVWWRYRARFGIDRQTWYAHFFGKSVVPLTQTEPPFWRINMPGRQVLFSAYHMADSYLPYYIKELNRRKPPWIQGYPSLLAVMAAFILSSGNGLSYRPRIVTVASESLLPQQKMIIEKAFGAPCRQGYGMTEGVAIISECPEGNLHVDEDYACVEFIPIEGNTYRIIGTGYTNHAFPLIRYDTGDVAELFEDNVKCPCGRPGRLVKSIDGRIEDYVITPDGRRIGRMDHIFKDMVNIKECQIYQDSPSRIVFRIVRGVKYTDDDERQIILETRKRLGREIAIEISYVEAVQRTKAGKLRFVISDLAQSKIGHIGKDLS